MGDFKNRDRNPVRSGKEIRKNIQTLDKTEVRLKKFRQGQQCECMHRAYGNPCLVPMKGADGTSTKFRCQMCGKIVSIDKKTPKQIDEAFDTIDTLCDEAKIVAKDGGSPVIMALVQYQKDSLRMKNVLTNIMGALNNKKHRDRDGQSGSSISYHWD